MGNGQRVTARLFAAAAGVMPPPPLQSSLEQRQQRNNENENILDVIIIGNGPSALALGSLLQRKWVVGTGGALELSSEALRDAARALAGRDLGDVGGSLLDSLGRKIPARCVSPTSAVVDGLRFPAADGRGATLLDADERRPSSGDGAPLAVAIVGRDPPGGSWHAMPGETLTVSPARWMSLPGLAWSAPPHPSGRATRGACAAYYERYAREVLSAGTCHCGEATAAEVRDGAWRVTVAAAGGERRALRGRALVLATGAYDEPRRLRIPGEDRAPLVVHRAPTAPRRRGQRLLVVGAGLSAADAVLGWLSGGGTVVHLFRGAAKETRLYAMFGGEHRDAYAGECQLARLVAGEATNPNYQPVSGRLTAVNEDGTVDLEMAAGGDAGDLRCAKFDVVAILVGGTPSLGFLAPSLRRRLPPASLPPGTKLDGTIGTHPVHVRVDTATGLVLAEDAGGEVLQDAPPLYALGPLRGDNFVRFVVGDAAAVANDLLRRKRKARSLETGEHQAEGMLAQSQNIQQLGPQKDQPD